MTWEANSDDIGTNMKRAPHFCMELSVGLQEHNNGVYSRGALQHWAEGAVSPGRCDHTLWETVIPRASGSSAGSCCNQQQTPEQQAERMPTEEKMKWQKPFLSSLAELVSEGKWATLATPKKELMWEITVH